MFKLATLWRSSRVDLYDLARCPGFFSGDQYEMVCCHVAASLPNDASVIAWTLRNWGEICPDCDGEVDDSCLWDPEDSEVSDDEDEPFH